MRLSLILTCALICLGVLAPTAAAQLAEGLDSRLVGTWVNEDNMNSGGGAGGFAAFSTVMTMQLGPDGSVLQTTRSVGGGAGWSSDSGESIDFQGTWRADGQTFSVLGMGLTDYTPAATYEFSGPYLVTYNDLGRLIWQRGQ